MPTEYTVCLGGKGLPPYDLVRKRAEFNSIGY